DRALRVAGLRELLDRRARHKHTATLGRSASGCVVDRAREPALGNDVADGFHGAHRKKMTVAMPSAVPTMMGPSQWALCSASDVCSSKSESATPISPSSANRMNPTKH